MKPTIRLVVLIAAVMFACSCAPGKDRRFVVYTYDSFVSEWGAGPAMKAGFEKATGMNVEFVSRGDGGALLASLLAETGRSSWDIVLGLDNQLAPRALEGDLLAAYRPKGIESIPANLFADDGGRLVPYDYGHFAFIWDSEKLADPPGSLEDLTLPAYAKKVIIMDPRTSTPGLGLVAWSRAVYGEAWQDFWRRLRPSVLAMTPGWDTGYGLFTSGEAPIVLSYVTSPAYHKEYENSERYKALIFPEGHPVQIEYAGIAKKSKNRKAAERFMDYLISAEAQALLPLTQWMYPVNVEVGLPGAFAVVEKPGTILETPRQNLVADAEIAADILAGVR